MIFVDTSAWYAPSVVRDTNHTAANCTLQSLREPLITSDFVVDETLTLLRSRGEKRLALKFGSKVIDRSFARIVSISEADFAQFGTVTVVP